MRFNTVRFIKDCCNTALCIKSRAFTARPFA
ncbi:Uncharacterised protein [Vibrio cholerae]|nr:Uncharacterised protein [Vibrio cholerae]